MRLIELDWIMNNIDKLDEDDLEAIDGLNLREQYKTGELDYSFSTMMEVMSLCMCIYKKYNK